MTTQADTPATEEVTAAAAFSGGFTGEETLPAEALETPAAPAETAEKPAEEVEAAQAVATPETVTITAEDWKRVNEQLASIDTLRTGFRKEIDGLGGKFGEVNRALKQRPAGVKLSAANFKNLQAEYPEFAELLAKDLGEIQPEAGEPAEPAPAATPAEATAETEPDAIKALEIGFEKKLLRSYHRDWVEVVNSAEFKAYEQSWPEAERTKFLNSNDGEYLADKLTEFKEHQKKAAAPAAPAPAPAPVEVPKPPARNKRLDAAITPSGVPGNSAPAKTERDYFREGYQQG